MYKCINKEKCTNGPLFLFLWIVKYKKHSIIKNYEKFGFGNPRNGILDVPSKIVSFKTYPILIYVSSRNDSHQGIYLYPLLFIDTPCSVARKHSIFNDHCQNTSYNNICIEDKITINCCCRPSASVYV